MTDMLKNKFGDMVTVKRERRIFIDTPFDRFEEVFNFVVNDWKANILVTITGLDEGDTFGIIYHMTRLSGEMVNIKTHISKTNPKLKTITARFPGADSYERELKDLLGIEIEGLPAGNRYPLPDNWPAGEYPLRKEWKGGAVNE